jgi:hypothetical protein
MKEIAETVGDISEIGQSRAIAALNARKSPNPVDIAALTDELESQISG